MKAHTALLRRFVCFGWVCRAAMLRTATLVLIHSTTEHCPAVWWRSAHTRLIDFTIHDVLRIVTGCLRPAPVDNLPFLAGTQPAELRRKGATLSLSRRAMAIGYLLPTPDLGGDRAQGHVNKVVLWPGWEGRKKNVDRCGSLLKEGCCCNLSVDVALNVRFTNGMCATNKTHIQYMWREQAIWEWSWHVISIVACCHSVKLCAIAARGFPLLLAHMRYGTLCDLWVWRRRINRRPCRSRMSNPSTSSLIARHDSPLWWHNWMAAQRLPRNLVRPGSGYNWFKRRRSQKLAKVIRSQFISQENWFRTFRRLMQN